MNFLNKIKIWFNALMYGLSDADKLIQGQVTDVNERHISINQLKDNQRVSHALLKGELTKEVRDLRYRDYLVAENSRRYNVQGDNAFSDRISILDEKNSIPKRFSGLNHEICASIQETVDVDVPSSYTLKFIYANSVKFLLEKYCSHFSVDENYITFYFSAIPNRNVVTSKAFCNHLNSMVVDFNKMGGEYSEIKEVWFVSYKITAVPNYTKFNFFDLKINSIQINNNEFLIRYKYSNRKVENLLDKYAIEDLKEKYQVKAEKYIPNSDIETYSIQNKCECCGREITYNEGKMNQAIVNKFCCGECLTKELIKTKDTLS